jgi:hypothetical protein
MKQFLIYILMTVALLFGSQNTSIAGTRFTTHDFETLGYNMTTLTSGSDNFSQTGYGVSQSDSAGSAESDGVPVTLNSLPAAPVAGSNSYAYDGTIKTASVKVGVGETVDWYANSTGGAAISAPSGTNAGSYFAYAEARNTITGSVGTTRTLITLNITKALLTVTADAKSKVYGAVNPVLTFTYCGWQNGDTKTVLTTAPSAVSTLTATSPVATYVNDIILSGGVAENYSFRYVPANFEVTEALLTVKADSQSKVYGSANPVLTLSYSGFKNGEGESVLVDMPTVSTSIGLLTPAGVYADAIVASGGSEHNYDIKYVPADFDVTKADLNIIADSRINSLASANLALISQFSERDYAENASTLRVKHIESSSASQITQDGFYPEAITGTEGMIQIKSKRETDSEVKWF